MKPLIYILMICFLLSCGARKRTVERDRTEMTTSTSASNESTKNTRSKATLKDNSVETTETTETETTLTVTPINIDKPAIFINPNTGKKDTLKNASAVFRKGKKATSNKIDKEVNFIHSTSEAVHEKRAENRSEAVKKDVKNSKLERKEPWFLYIFVLLLLASVAYLLRKYLLDGI